MIYHVIIFLKWLIFIIENQIKLFHAYVVFATLCSDFPMPNKIIGREKRETLFDYFRRNQDDRFWSNGDLRD